MMDVVPLHIFPMQMYPRRVFAILVPHRDRDIIITMLTAAQVNYF